MRPLGLFCGCLTCSKALAESGLPSFLRYRSSENRLRANLGHQGNREQDGRLEVIRNPGLARRYGSDTLPV